MMTLAQVLAAAPATPDCFPSRESWAGYLLNWQNETKKKPFDKSSVYRLEFNFCADCTLEWTTKMARDGNCDPSQFRRVIRVIPVVEVAYVGVD